LPATRAPNPESDRFTDSEHWDQYWQGTRLPVEAHRDPSAPQVNAILDVLDAHASPGGTALEVGGGLGRYLAYLGRTHGCRCTAMDFSPEGCELARRNFELLGLPLEVHQRDVLDPGEPPGRFDLVYSLGLIEHFTDLTGVVAAHARLVRPGGTLVLGAPNVVGVNRWFMERLAPERMAVHNADCLRIERWDDFERQLGLVRLYRDYVGGFEPRVFAVRERRTPATLPLWAVTQGLVVTVGRRMHWLRRFNPPRLSGYLIGAWRVPG
jgi:SAM-dependent methyltransferase